MTTVWIVRGREQERLLLWLRHLRKERGWTQEAVAEKAGWTLRNLKAKLGQPNSIGTDNLMKIVAALGLPGEPELQMARFWLGPAPDPAHLAALLDDIPGDRLKDAAKRLSLLNEEGERAIRRLERMQAALDDED